VKKVLITGAARGIGLATAGQFAAAGWKVLSLDKEFGSEVVGERVQFDLRHISEIPSLIVSLGELDTLVNNAGVLHCDPIDAIPEAHRSEILAVNLEAPAALIAAVAPGMTARRGGRVVNVSSVAAFTGHPDLWYGITKAGLLNLTKSWARALGPCGIFGERGRAWTNRDAYVRATAAIPPGRRHAHRLRAACLQARGSGRNDLLAR
jgi:NAD(P)-dependent dehydrogenase (short-subunit alcohol dehydrogenase family)